MATPVEHSSRKILLTLKEGFLYKKGGIIKSWARRYFILTHQSLCYFRRECEEGLEPLGRIFLSDIVKIETEGIEKKKAFVFALHTKKRAVLLQAANHEDRDKWVEVIRRTLETDKEAERKDPFRKTLRKLAPGLKRVTLVKDPEKGIGCTIKNAAGHILVNRIIEEGPIAHTGVLRPGDEFLDIHGKSVTGLEVAQVVEVIRSAPDQFLATVRPITALKKGYKADTGKILYSEIVQMESGKFGITNGATATSPAHTPLDKGTSPAHRPLDEPQPLSDSLEDLGNYDDEDEGDMPPPLPPRTEDALILVDPPPNAKRPPPLPPKPKQSYPNFKTTDSAQPRKHLNRARPLCDHKELAVLTQQHRQKSEENLRGFRPPMQKSRSQGDSVHDTVGIMVMPEATTTRDYRRRPRVHNYEEIKPKIIYADVDFLQAQRQKKISTLN